MKVAENLSPQQVRAGRSNEAQSRRTSALFASEDGAPDVIATQNLDRPKNRMAGSGRQGDFVRRYFDKVDPSFKNEIDSWNFKNLTGGGGPGIEWAQRKMEMGSPLIG